MDNIEYEHLCQHAKGIDRETLDEIVDLLVETVCSARKTIRMKTLLKKSMFIAVSLALFTCTCLMLSACAANATSAPEIPRTSGEDQPAPMNISTQVSSDVIADENCLPGGPSDTQPEYWEIEEFEVWMEQQRDQIQKLADNKDKSFYYKDDNGSYVCREWTQEDVDSLYESWQDQLALMKEGYHFMSTVTSQNQTAPVVRQYKIGGVRYIVKATVKDGAKETAVKKIRRLLQNDLSKAAT